MKKIDTSAISTTNAFPVKSGTLQHLQAAYTEAISEGMKALVGFAYDPTKIYILNGLRNTGAGLNYIISAGSVYFNGEIYLVDAVTITIVGPNVLTGVITTSFFSAFNADPVEFTDGVPRNVHQIRKVVLQSGLSGSGIGNYTDFIDLSRRLTGTIGEIKIWNWRFYGGVYSDYFDNTGLGIHPYTLGWAEANGNHSTDNMKGNGPVGYDAGDAPISVPFTDAAGSNEATIATDNLPAQMDVEFKDCKRLSLATFEPSNENHGVYVVGLGGSSTITPLGQADQLFSIKNTGGGQPLDVRNKVRAVLFVQRIA